MKEKVNQIKGSIGKFFADLDDKQRYYVFGGILLAIFLIDFFVLMMPQWKSLDDINAKIRVKSKEIKESTENINKENYYKSEVERLKEELLMVTLKVNSKEEVPLILERISTIALENGLRIDQIRPDVEMQEELLSNDEFVYYALPISIEATSKYHDFGRLLNAVENDDMALSVSSFAIASKRDSKNHRVNLTINAIVYEKNLGKKKKK